MDRKRWDIVIPAITIVLMIIAIIIALAKDAKKQPTEESKVTTIATNAEVATASEATPAAAKEEPEPTIEVVHYKSTTESTTQATTTEEIVTEVFSVITTEEWTEEPLPPEEPQEPEPPVEPTAPDGMTYLGTYYCTGYTATGNATSSGVMPEVGVTAACNSLPTGTVIYIDGIGTRVIQDTGGMGATTIDVFCGTVSDCYAITGNYEVYIVE